LTLWHSIDGYATLLYQGPEGSDSETPGRDEAIRPKAASIPRYRDRREEHGAFDQATLYAAITLKRKERGLRAMDVGSSEPGRVPIGAADRDRSDGPEGR
jgi:hypothetical protein